MFVSLPAPKEHYNLQPLVYSVAVISSVFMSCEYPLKIMLLYEDFEIVKPGALRLICLSVCLSGTQFCDVVPLNSKSAPD